MSDEFSEEICQGESRDSPSEENSGSNTDQKQPTDSDEAAAERIELRRVLWVMYKEELYSRKTELGLTQESIAHELQENEGSVQRSLVQLTGRDLAECENSRYVLTHSGRSLGQTIESSRTNREFSTAIVIFAGASGFTAVSNFIAVHLLDGTPPLPWTAGTLGIVLLILIVGAIYIESIALPWNQVFQKNRASTLQRSIRSVRMKLPDYD